MDDRGEERPDFDSRRGDLARAAGQLEQATAPPAARPADPLVRDAVAGRPGQSLDRPGLPRRADRPGTASRGGVAGPRSRVSTGLPTRGSSCSIPRPTTMWPGWHASWAPLTWHRASCPRRSWPVCCRAGSSWPSARSSATAGPAPRSRKPRPSPGPGWLIFWATRNVYIQSPRRPPVARSRRLKSTTDRRGRSRSILEKNP